MFSLEEEGVKYSVTDDLFAHSIS